VDKEVYKIRAKCCDNTHECVNVRFAALNITDESEFEEKGSCLNDCGEQFSNHNPHPCTSSKINLDEVTEQNRIKSCNDACIGKFFCYICSTIYKIFDIVHYVESKHVVKIIHI
jgi:hypothetical protein